MRKKTTGIDREQGAGRPNAGGGRSESNDAPPHRSSLGNIGIARRPRLLDDPFFLTVTRLVCYGSRLSSRPRVRPNPPVLDAQPIRTIFGRFCHELYFPRAVLFFSLVIGLEAQTYTPSLPPPPPAPVQPSPILNQAIQAPRDIVPKIDEVTIDSLCTGDEVCTQESKGPWTYLRGRHRIVTTESELRADELDYNDETNYVEARGKVEYQNFRSQEKLYADKVEYYVDDEAGKFYNVSGSAPFRVDTRPGLLTTANPFYFQAKWAERLQDKYILHEGFLTDCVIPNPWWTLRGKTFEIYPRDHAIAYKSWFYIKNIPLFYLPKFYKRLEKHPRHSGILLPSGGTNSLKGQFIDAGYYWAINRSYDLTYEGTYFTKVGLSHSVDFRGKVNQYTDFTLTLNALDNKSSNPDISAGGYQILLDGRSLLGDGWEARGHLDLLSSFAYRSEFSLSINEAVYTQTRSTAFIDKHWNDYGVNFVIDRDVDFQSATEGDQVEVRKLPEADFIMREHELFDLPLWFSFDSSDGFMHRNEPDYQTRQFVNRGNFVPRATTAFHFLGIHVTPSFALHETFYSSSFNSAGQVTPSDLVRNARDVGVDIVLPSLERVFDAPAWIGTKVKHVIEPRITYRYTNGVDNFNQIIRFDQTDLLSDTNQVEFSIANRLLAKDKNGTVTDLLSWQLYYDRYFNPTFGGAVVAGQASLVESIAELTGYTFLDRPRHQSPVVSVMRLQTKVGLDWRTEWDPIRRGFIDTGVNANYRFSRFVMSLGETRVRTDPILLSNTDQIRASVTYGNQNKRGLSYGANMFYDIHLGIFEGLTAQGSYNTDCCGLSLQYRRIFIGTRDEHQYLLSFEISNIGSVGTLNRQERLF
jgi:LPS-assembly protein